MFSCNENMAKGIPFAALWAQFGHNSKCKNILTSVRYTVNRPFAQKSILDFGDSYQSGCHMYILQILCMRAHTQRNYHTIFAQKLH